MGGEKYSKFSRQEFQIFQPRISLLYSIRHSISLTSVACGSFPSLRFASAHLQMTFAIRPSLRSASLYYTYR
nr:MAG TPA: hypothetical protein [Caudoviricetes sp.]